MLRRIEVCAEGTPLRPCQQAAHRLFALLDRRCPAALAPGALTLISAGPHISAALHAAHFDAPDATDVMTFPVDDSPWQVGTLVLCPEVILRQARAYGATPTREATRYLIHGWLHLIGCDDAEPAQRRALRFREQALLALAARWRALVPLRRDRR